MNASRFVLRCAALAAIPLASTASAQGPSFDCGKVAPGSIEALVCADAGLAALDRRLAGVYAEAVRKAADQQPPTLRAEQRGWVKGRNDCWKADDQRDCVASAYTRRIAELQANYRLVASRGVVYWTCDGNPANEVVTEVFETDPPTVRAERGDSTTLMFPEASGSGAKYVGRNESFWEHQGEARITWGPGAPEMTCVRREPGA